jgi:ABC-type phosphate transport system substrate-binding protein
MPIDNLSRLMVLQIFSSDNQKWLDRWNQFGPWYPDAGIVRCMRCAGSGTHATFDLQVFRGDATLMPTSILGRFYHHESSSDLTKCVNDNGWPSSFGPVPWAGTAYEGDTRLAVGYADADKILKDDDYPNVHIVKYQGVEPARAKIENNEYNYWASQTLYWQTSVITAAGLDDLLNSLLAAAQNSAFIDTIEGRNLFWTTPGSMACQKVPNERAYPTVVPESSPAYPGGL